MSLFTDCLLALGMILFFTYTANWMAQGAVLPLQISGEGVILDPQTVLIRGKYIRLEENDVTLSRYLAGSFEKPYLVCDIKESQTPWSYTGICMINKND